MERFIEKCCANYSLHKEDVNLLLSTMEYKSFKKGDFLVREGGTNNNLCIIKSGVLRAFRNNDGEDISVWFASEGEVL